MCRLSTQLKEQHNRTNNHVRIYLNNSSAEMFQIRSMKPNIRCSAQRLCNPAGGDKTHFSPTRGEVVSRDSSLASLLVGSALHLWTRMRDDDVHISAHSLSVAALLRVAHVPHRLSPNLGRRAGVCFVSWSVSIYTPKFCS